jgi:hypothetical protein
VLIVITTAAELELGVTEVGVKLHNAEITGALEQEKLTPPGKDADWKYAEIVAGRLSSADGLRRGSEGAKREILNDGERNREAVAGRSGNILRGYSDGVGTNAFVVTLMVAIRNALAPAVLASELGASEHWPPSKPVLQEAFHRTVVITMTA